MTTTLPNHVAAADEDLAPLGDDPAAGPDLAEVMPVEDMLKDLATLADDPDDYADEWRECLVSAGGSITLRIDCAGEDVLWIGMPCDAQARQRNRYLHFLFLDLNVDARRRERVVAQLKRQGRYIDDRPAVARDTTAAIRGYLHTEGRIMITPSGGLMTGGGLPKAWINGTDNDRIAIGLASTAYTQASRKAGADVHIKRVVRMLGTPTDNGWLVLEARS